MTVEHVIRLVLVKTGMRMGAAHGLDLEDYHPDEDPPHLDLSHRPDTDTSLKNSRQGERPVSIPQEAVEIIDDYRENKRPDVTDELGRNPLLASNMGRLSKSTIRKYIYKWSRPCVYGVDCPHEKDPEDCEAAQSLEKASKWPSSVTPHPIRRGYITRLLTAGVPVDVISERCNVSAMVIDEHYDVRTDDEKMRQREEIIHDILD